MLSFFVPVPSSIYSITSTILLRQQRKDKIYVLLRARYPDIFESAAFSFRIQKFSRPHLVYSNRIRLFTRIPWNPYSLPASTQGFSAIKCVQSIRNKGRDSSGMFCCCCCAATLVLFFGKRLDTNLLRHRIRKYPD